MDRKSIEQTLDTIRPYLREDGGDVELVRVHEDGILEVRFTGSCVSCPLSIMTLRAGIERALMLKHPDVRRVEQVK